MFKDPGSLPSTKIFKTRFETSGQCYKTFLVRKFQNELARVFVPVKSFQPSVMFVGKTGAYLR